MKTAQQWREELKHWGEYISGGVSGRVSYWVDQLLADMEELEGSRARWKESAETFYKVARAGAFRAEELERQIAVYKEDRLVLVGRINELQETLLSHLEDV